LVNFEKERKIESFEKLEPNFICKLIQYLDILFVNDNARKNQTYTEYLYKINEGIVAKTLPSSKNSLPDWNRFLPFAFRHCNFKASARATALYEGRRYEHRVSIPSASI
jgi:hypothetical protein